MSSSNEAAYRRIIALFADVMDVNLHSPFSLQNIVAVSDIAAGDWFGPGAACTPLATLVNAWPGFQGDYWSHALPSSFSPSNSTIRMTICHDGMMIGSIAESRVGITKHWSAVTLDDITPLDEWTPCLFVFPLRLGIDNISENYQKVIRKMMTFPQSAGIVGGRPRASLYFFGMQVCCTWSVSG